MYKIYLNDEILSNPMMDTMGYCVSDPELEMELNQPGNLTFSVPKSNPLYDEIVTRTAYIKAYDDSEELFYGRIIDITRDFNNNLKVYAEGALAFFADSIYRPFVYRGSVDGLFSALVENHNAQVDEARRFAVGNVTVTDPNDYILRSSENPDTTWNFLNEKLVELLGGYLSIRLEDGVRYIDYLADHEELTLQTVEFGKNLLDLSDFVDGTDVITCLIPYGVRYEEDSTDYEAAPENGSYDGNRLTIKSVNNGLDYVENAAGIARYGRIWGTNTWDDVTEAANLLSKAKAFLEESVADTTTIAAKVLDQHLVNPQVPRIKVGYAVKTYSVPHNINMQLICTKQRICFDSPDSDEVTLGTSYKTLTGIQSATATEVRQTATSGTNATPNNAGTHNAVYRGKNLGSTVTDEQKNGIRAGTFDDLYIGDYWTINGVVYRIAAFDYYFNTGDTVCKTHHVTLVPDTALYSHAMNSTATTDGAYANSLMYTEGLDEAKEIINEAFGGVFGILNHRTLLADATTAGYESHAAYYDSTVELMSEANVIGYRNGGNSMNGNAYPYNYSLDQTQFPLFRYRPDLIGIRKGFFLRDVVSANWFAAVTPNGAVGYHSATTTGGVRPSFSVYCDSVG